MSRIRLLVGTKKGAFILSADGSRKRWRVSGPHFAGWEIYHLNPSRRFQIGMRSRIRDHGGSRHYAQAVYFFTGL